MDKDDDERIKKKQKKKDKIQIPDWNIAWGKMNSSP